MHHTAFFRKYKLHHLLIWLLLLGIWFMLRYEDYASPAKAFQVTIIKVVDLALLVYLTNVVLIPRLLYKKKYFLFAVLFILMIAGSSMVKMNILGRLTNNRLLTDFAGNWKDRLYDNIIPHFFLVIAGAAIKLMYDQISLQKKIAEMAKEKAVAELNFLKSQINPHFLFNSLNTVYFLIDKTNPEARRALHKFSDMLRYLLYEANGEKIPIEKEIAYLKDYVDLQKLRKDENYSVLFHSQPEVNGFYIEPLLLIPFVENAFKFISHKAEGNNFVKLYLGCHHGVFEFSVENSKESENPEANQSGGIGLNNVKRRLELLYPESHELCIHNDASFFRVNLKIKI